MTSFTFEIFAKRKSAYDDMIDILTDTSCNKTEECANWNKKYQSDFSGAKTIKDSFLGLYEDNKDFDLSSLFINSLSRMGLVDYLNRNEELTSLQVYRDLENYLNEIREFKLINCLEWCISNLTDHQQILKCFQLFTYQILIASNESNDKKIEIIFLIRKFIKIHSYLNFEKLIKNFELQTLITQKCLKINQDEIRLRIMNLFASIYLNNQNLPIFDILQLR
jgi:hypothetical protein